jgi:hypothetical protein
MAHPDTDGTGSLSCPYQTTLPPRTTFTMRPGFSAGERAEGGIWSVQDNWSAPPGQVNE